MMPTPSDASDSNLQIQQEVKGDRNQVIGQAIDSTIVNFAGEGQVIHLTIHDRVPEQSAPPPIHEVKPLTQQEYRQRQILLSKVRDDWVKGLLEKSLHARVLIELGLKERLDLVQRPFSGMAEFAEVSGQDLPQGTDATKIFNQMAVGRTLLILGEPGSGKTITLLKLAQDLLARTETNLRQPIPVVFNLSSWAKKLQSIEAWLVQELLEKYQVSKALGKKWVETESLILLLDGLDEVKAEHRNACVQALNQFMQTHGTTELIICCRIQDYQSLAERLLLRSAICIQPLTSDQIDQYFEEVGEQLASLKEVLHQDEELQGLATSPLMLSVMSLAYQGSNPKDVIQGGTPEDYRQRLFDTYIDRMFGRRGTTQQYSRQKTQHWLIWLAQRMTNAAQTVFLIERLQPSWLPNKNQQLCYRLESGLISGLTIGVILGLISKSGLIFLFANLLIGIILGFVNPEIKTNEILKWSWGKTIPGMLVGLFLGLAIEIILLISITPITNQLGIGMYFFQRHLISAGLKIILAFGLLGSLIGGLTGSSELTSKRIPNQGIWRTIINSGISGLIGGLISGLFFGLLSSQIFNDDFFDLIGRMSNHLIAEMTNEYGSDTIYISDSELNLVDKHLIQFNIVAGLIFGVIGGLISWLYGGGSACIKHLILRSILFQKGYSPWNYARFLDYATDRLFLQKVGGGYIFFHRMLLEHFAAMPLEQEKR